MNTLMHKWNNPLRQKWSKSASINQRKALKLSWFPRSKTSTDRVDGVKAEQRITGGDSSESTSILKEIQDDLVIIKEYMKDRANVRWWESMTPTILSLLSFRNQKHNRFKWVLHIFHHSYSDYIKNWLRRVTLINRSRKWYESIRTLREIWLMDQPTSFKHFFSSDYRERQENLSQCIGVHEKNESCMSLCRAGTRGSVRWWTKNEDDLKWSDEFNERNHLSSMMRPVQVLLGMIGG